MTKDKSFKLNGATPGMLLLKMGLCVCTNVVVEDPVGKYLTL